jgi:hypothetical protein
MSLKTRQLQLERGDGVPIFHRQHRANDSQNEGTTHDVTENKRREEEAGGDIQGCE